MPRKGAKPSYEQMTVHLINQADKEDMERSIRRKTRREASGESKDCEKGRSAAGPSKFVIAERKRMISES